MRTILLFLLCISASLCSWANAPVGDCIAQAAQSSAQNTMEPLFFIIVALVIGAATRHLLKKTPVPYTVLLMILGIAVGVLSRFGVLGILELDYFSSSVIWAGNIDPHVILYVFLPILVFEAAFAMDVHVFKKTAVNATLLSVPGILVSMALTAVLAMSLVYYGFGIAEWTWPIAFMFGAVVSATDPVAVVSLLKELGASKKLAMLIEGESLLNDGTAIVLFMVFFLGMTGQASGHSPIFEFMWVSFGGLLVGFGLAYMSIQWVKRIFNDAMVEITIIIASAYLCFFVAEHFLHVSGVLALVAFGLTMSGVGRTRISPEVEHFLHEFWELAAFIANTLIFIIVGVVIAQKTVFVASDLWVLMIIYVGVHAVRAIMIGLHYPIIKHVGYGLDRKEAAILWWGGLRGAIALALALVVTGADDAYIPAAVKHQFLFYTAGLVTLTLLINATTVNLLLCFLGMNIQSPAKILMLKNAEKFLRNSSKTAIERLKLDRFMGKANWLAVETLLPKLSEDAGNSDPLVADTLLESRRLLLEKEKTSYWKLFQSGLLGPVAVGRLTETIDDMLDRGGVLPLSSRADLEDMWKTSKLFSRAQEMPFIGDIAKRIYFDQLTVSYDSAKAFVAAQEESLNLLDNMKQTLSSEDDVNKRNLSKLEDEVNENIIEGQTFLRNLRKNLPEIYFAIATRQAMRSVLNHQQQTVERLCKNGQLTVTDSILFRERIDAKIKDLMDSPIAISELETNELLKDVPILKDLSPEQIKQVIERSETLVFSVGDSLIKADTHTDSVMLIIRGTVKVRYHDNIVAVLGPASIVGEIAMLTGYGHNATVVAESPVTVLRIEFLQVHELMAMSKSLREELWRIAGHRIARDMLKDIAPFSSWDDKTFERWSNQGEIVLHVHPETVYSLEGKIGILLSGVAILDNMTHTQLNAPAIIDSINVRLDRNSYLFVNNIPG